MSDVASDPADDSLFHISPSTSPASAKMDSDRELDDLLPFLEEGASPKQPRGLLAERSPLDVEICLSARGDDLTINVNMCGVDLMCFKEDVNTDAAESEYNFTAMKFDTAESDDSTCSIGEVEDVDVFGEEEDDDDDVETIVPQVVDEDEQCQVVDEEEQDIVQLHKGEVTMCFATEYISQVIQSVLDSASVRPGEDASEGQAVDAGPPIVYDPAETCATVEAAQAPTAPRVQLEEPEAASPTRPISSRSLVSSRSRRRIIGAVVRSPAPAELVESSLSITVPTSSPALSQFDPTSPKASGSTPLRCLRSRGSKDKAGAKKKSMTVFRMDMQDEASPTESLARSSSLAARYDTLGAELYSLHDRSDACSPPPFASGRRCRGAEPDFDKAPAAAPSRTGPSRAHSSSALAMDLGLEPESSRGGGGFSPLSPRATSAGSKGAGALIRSSSSTGSISFSKAKKLPFTSLPAAASKRQGLLPELPTSPSSAGSIAWSMRLAKTGAKRGGLASVF